jgi:hypothetical protein
LVEVDLDGERRAAVVAKRNARSPHPAMSA